MTVCLRMFFLSSALAAAGVTHIAAQSFDLFGGFKFADMKPAQDYDSVTMSGWNASATVHPVHRIGLTADLRATTAPRQHRLRSCPVNRM